ncbi:MAG: DUF4097 family beta strand repeat-containing protein [Halolamina sp.]
MKRTPTRRRLLAGVGAAALTGLAGCTGATPFVGKRLEEDRTIAIEDTTALTVDAELGEVTVWSEDREDVGVQLVKQSSSVGVDLSDLHFTVEHVDGRLALASRYTGDNSILGGTPNMDLTLRVPRDFTVAELAADVGDLRAEDVAGDLTARSSVGDVTLRDVTGTVTAASSTGDVDVRGAERVGDVSTETGDLDVAVSAIDGDTTMESRVGDATVALSSDLDADIVAETRVGDVEVDDLSLRDVTETGNSLTGTLGDGGPTLRITTETGDVELSSLPAGSEH